MLTSTVHRLACRLEQVRKSGPSIIQSKSSSHSIVFKVLMWVMRDLGSYAGGALGASSFPCPLFSCRSSSLSRSVVAVQTFSAYPLTLPSAFSFRFGQALWMWPYRPHRKHLSSCCLVLHSILLKPHSIDIKLKGSLSHQPAQSPLPTATVSMSITSGSLRDCHCVGLPGRFERRQHGTREAMEECQLVRRRGTSGAVCIRKTGTVRSDHFGRCSGNCHCMPVAQNS